MSSGIVDTPWHEGDIQTKRNGVRNTSRRSLKQIMNLIGSDATEQIDEKYQDGETENRAGCNSPAGFLNGIFHFGSEKCPVVGRAINNQSRQSSDILDAMRFRNCKMAILCQTFLNDYILTKRGTYFQSLSLANDRRDFVKKV